MADDPVTNPAKNRGEPDFDMALLKVRKRRRKVNKAKRAAEEVTYLNIVAMVDVLTILLIFLLKSVSVSSTAVPMTGSLTLPYSTTRELPIEAAKVFVTRSKIIIEDKEVAQIYNGAVESRWLSPSNSYVIPSLEETLSNWLKWHLFFKGPGGKPNMSLEILADKETPYRIIMQVLYTAGKAKGERENHQVFFDNYRLLVMRSAE